MEKNFQTTFSSSGYEVTPTLDERAVDYWNPEAVADCLMDAEAYQVYLHMDQYDTAHVFTMALEEAELIVAARQAIFEQRTTTVRRLTA